MTDIDNDLTTEIDRDGSELHYCNSSEERHGAHPWYDVEDAGERLWCSGWGQITVSFSELDTFRQCPKKHDLAYNGRWQRDSDDRSALGLGSLWHRVLEVHYKTIMKAQRKGYPDGKLYWDVSEDDLRTACLDAVESLLREMLEDEQREPEVIEILMWMYEGHLEVFGLDEQYDILGAETTALMTLKNADGSDSWVRIKVKLDLIVRDEKGHIWVIDHKSASSIGRDDMDHDWNDQFGLYVAVMRKQGLKVFGAIHSAALKKPNKGDFIKPGMDGYKASMKETPLENRFKRTRLNRTEAECESIMQDAVADAKLAYSEANHKRRHANPDTCKWKCDFKEACIFGRRTNNEENVLLTLQRTGFAQEPTRH
jgi:hypothetical protein